MTRKKAGVAPPPPTGDIETGECEQDGPAYRTDFRELPVSAVVPDPAQPREYFNPEEMKELKDSITSVGLLQPITVREQSARGGLHGVEVEVAPGATVRMEYVIVTGERRWRAHVELERATIPAMVRVGAADASPARLFIEQMVENLNRADMNPMEEAAGFKRIIQEHPDWQPSDVAKSVGKSTQLVNLRLPLNDLIDEFKHMTAKGLIKAVTAAQLGLLDPGQQRAALVKYGKGEFASDNEFLHYAYKVRQQGEITMIVDVFELSPEQRAEREKAKKTQLSLLQRFEALAQEVRKLADPNKLAEAHGPGLPVVIDRVAACQKTFADYMFNLRQARAAWSAAGGEISGDALPEPDDVKSVSGHAAIS